MRHRVHKTAAQLKTASCGRPAIRNPACPSFVQLNAAPPPGAGSGVRPAPASTPTIPIDNGGMRTTLATASVHQAAAGALNHPNSSRSRNAVGTRLRLTLSRIFHCESGKAGLAGSASPAPAHAAAASGHLPVAAEPAFLPSRVGVVARGIVFVQVHVAQQSGTARGTFQQVVAEDAIRESARRARARKRPRRRCPCR